MAIAAGLVAAAAEGLSGFAEPRSRAVFADPFVTG